ncbi:YdeI/OmpD-associated family protein [Saliterribacillus persicus]|uniref:Bacteriocin resistance YdeI/OmpD-like protein n=1 Tax=Saliterribacillus persicus TaxID=930114 RepID=A0A368Y9F9_9BACI|nr:YdeI/OmpD-associated family protein [Saliterribacillus persicus]RCW76911.1 bacteriocin resistance YdeI/OmpD-like protein [Saliterribacillus persicus]
MAKSIVEKLKLDQYEKVVILNQPKNIDYFDSLEDVDDHFKGDNYNLVIGFVYTLDELVTQLDEVINKDVMIEAGYIYLAYPKKGNKKYDSFIHRDQLLPRLNANNEGYIGESTIKFARMVSLDDTYTMVGFKKDARSKGKVSKKASQLVGDYVDKVSWIEQDLVNTPDLLLFYQNLTPGYKKDWARYVYSAKREETREKRKTEMRMILEKGYKSRDLYKKDN